MIPIAFKKVWIENKIANHYKTKHILSKLGDIDIDYFDDLNTLIHNTPTVFHPKDRSQTLVLSAIRGEILRKCPGTHGHLCGAARCQREGQRKGEYDCDDLLHHCCFPPNKIFLCYFFSILVFLPLMVQIDNIH